MNVGTCETVLVLLDALHTQLCAVLALEPHGDFAAETQFMTIYGHMHAV